MVLIVEDGTGKSDAESYASVVEADAYFTSLNNASWTGDDVTKEAALRSATSYLDATYTWNGYIYSDDQALGFPRTSIYDKEGRDLSESVPINVKKATYELAVAALSGDLVENINSSDYVKREKVGSLEVEYSDARPTGSGTQYSLADRFLSGLYSQKLGGSFSNSSVVRA